VTCPISVAPIMTLTRSRQLHHRVLPPREPCLRVAPAVPRMAQIGGQRTQHTSPGRRDLRTNGATWPAGRDAAMASGALIGLRGVAGAAAGSETPWRIVSARSHWARARSSSRCGCGARQHPVGRLGQVQPDRSGPIRWPVRHDRQPGRSVRRGVCVDCPAAAVCLFGERLPFYLWAFRHTQPAGGG
jgi:hypothetical protein